ncbi:MAG: hypothetical protein HY302_04570 [Opitutae bacterium]|nr:hypothetical protein [Opitutae bacterium]
MNTTLQSDTGRLLKVIVKSAPDAFVSPAKLAAEWQPLNFTHCPDLARAEAESDAFAALLRRLGAEVLPAPRDDAQSIDSLYIRDAGIVCDRGLILCSMGKANRRAEPAALRRAAEAWGVPVAGEITGTGRVEGGDVAWIDSRTLAIARSYRTNDEGIRQLRTLLGNCVDDLVVVPLPHYRGPSDVFHLMSIYSPLAPGLALVHSPLMPVPFRELLLAKGNTLVEVAPEEIDSLGCNVLAVAPRVCVMAAGNPVTRRRLLDAGCEVHEFSGEEIAKKGGGGPTCLTRPLARAV